jgi:ankyrin repeat domain-containing protein 17
LFVSLLSRSLKAACTDNDVNAVKRLLGDGNTLHDATDDGDSLLSLACSAGYFELAQVLLAMQAQVEDRGQKNDCTPLMEAASAGHIDIMDLLLRHGADVNAQSSTGEFCLFGDNNKNVLSVFFLNSRQYTPHVRLC